MKRDGQPLSSAELARAQQQAFEAGERMRLIIASVRDYAIFMLDKDGRVATWNTGAELTKGYRADEIIGKSLELFYEPHDRERGLPRVLLAQALRDGRVENEGWRVRNDGSRFWADVVITALRDATGEHVGYAKVTRDLTERRRADEERLKLARAEEAIHLRDEFLSIASHELRTPLTALKLQIDGLLEHLDTLEGKLAKKVERAVRSVRQLERLIETLLDVSRIATGHLTLDPQEFDLSESLAHLLETLHEHAAKAAAPLCYETSGPVFGCWDRMRVEQVVTNLVSNAIKYGAGAPIAVTLRAHEGEALIEVNDRGPGVPEADIARIFGRFERATSSRHHGGLGLGLYLSQEIVLAHGGSIAARNLASGGARFTVRLPLRTEGCSGAEESSR